MNPNAAARWAMCLALFPVIAVSSPSASEPIIDSRSACRAAVEDFKWAQRIWPEHNVQPKPPREALLSDQGIQLALQNERRMESALAGLYGVRIDDAALQAEMRRMAKNSRAPDRLLALFQALDHDPRAVAECVAHPALLERRLRNAYAWDSRRHEATRLRAKAALAKGASAGHLQNAGATVTRLVLVRASDGSLLAGPDQGASDAEIITIEPQAFLHERARLGIGTTQTRSDHAGSTVPTLRETESAFLFEMVLSESVDRIEVQIAAWPKQPFDAWWQQVAPHWPEYTAKAEAGLLQLPQVKGLTAPRGSDDPGVWFPQRAPLARAGHRSVWTGSEMLIFGGQAFGPGGHRYDPATDTWTPMATVDEPAARFDHSAVWTGTELLVWGLDGFTFSSQGGRYNPMLDLWTPLGENGAPTARAHHVAIWTGTEMIVWGGSGGANGDRYDPVADAWLPVSGIDAPGIAYGLGAIWTGGEMILWGDFFSDPSGRAARYDPIGDAWTYSEPAPIQVFGPPVWSGEEMIVWGPCMAESCAGTAGLRYNPSDDEWVALSTVGAPDERWGHTAIWTGSEMFVWGGTMFGDALDDGARYHPVLNEWAALPTGGAPQARSEHTAVWTGSEMIVWGGRFRSGAADVLETGARFDPTQGTWAATAASNAPTARTAHSTVWTGQEMIVWGGRLFSTRLASGGMYEPATDTWTATPMTGAPSPRERHTAIWTGLEVLVWGGSSGFTLFGDGRHFRPDTLSWTATGSELAPDAREDHTSVWTGSEMLVWGGWGNDGLMSTGARYDPDTREWSPIPGVDSPDARNGHTAVWTGSRMIIWGGHGHTSGGRFHPASDTWLPTATEGAPPARTGHSAIWSGNEMIVWGGSPLTDVGARYLPDTDEWLPISTDAAPARRFGHTAVWTGEEMIVWGGAGGFFGPGGFTPFNTGGRYRPATDSWQATTVEGAPRHRSGHSAVWTGAQMVVWGGMCCSEDLGIYDPAPNETPLHLIFRNGFE